MKVLHVISSIGRDGGGPSRSSQGLVAALCKAGVDAWIYPLDAAEPWVPGVRRYVIDIGDGGMCTEEMKKFDLVHIHGIWDVRLHKVAVMCREAGVPYVISPRGMLEPWSLRQKWFKKRIARWLYQDRDLRLAAVLHATADSEAEQFRNLGFENKIVISPNGVNVPDRTFKAKAKDEGEQRRALFVSRMHPKKGVLELVESWARVRDLVKARSEGEQWICELVYTVSGEVELGYEQKVKARVHELGLDDQFVFTGQLDDEKKWEAYGRANLFVLPTYSENFGIVVAEALWAGVPVITTKGTPWADLKTHNCGWLIDLPPTNSLDMALKEATMSRNLIEMGQRGRKLVEERYTWSAVSEKMIQGYVELKANC